MEVKSGLNILGILFTMLGAVFEIWGALNSNRKVLGKQASSCWGYNPHLYKCLVEQRIRTILGFVLISIGSLIQFASMIVSGSYNNTHYIPIYLLIGIVVFIIVLFYWISKLLIKRDINFFLVPKELEDVKSSIEKLESLDGEHLKNKKMHIIKTSNCLSQRIGLNMRIKDEFNLEIIKDTIEKVVKYVDKHNLN